MSSNFSKLDDDIAALEEYLLSSDVPEETMLLSTLDGYLTAIAVSPRAIPPEEWLPEIWGGDIPPLAVQADANWVVGAIRSHCDRIRCLLADNPDLLDPILEEDTDGSLLPEIWAEGFMRGVQLRRQDWAPLFEGEGWRLLAPIGIFAETPDGNQPLILSEPRRDEVRKNARTLLQASVAGLYGFWRATHRPAEDAPRPVRFTGRIGGKVGRNASCPCGSGNKYKRCCGA